MKLFPALKILIIATVICGFSFKTRAQQLASQKPLSSFYNEKTQARLTAKKENNSHLSPLQNQRNLPSVKPLPRQADGSIKKNAVFARNAALSDNEKIKKLPSKSALTVNQIATRKYAVRKSLHSQLQ